VLRAGIQDRRLLAVLVVPRALADLHRENVLAVDGLADSDGLGDRRVVGGGLLELRLDAAFAGVLLVDLVAIGRQRIRLLGRGLAVHLLGLHLDALLGQLLGLPRADDRLDPHLRLFAALSGDLAELQVVTVDAEVDELGDLAAGHLSDVDIEMVVPRSGDRGAGAQQAGDERQDGKD
jgi:hypothetical protein